MALRLLLSAFVASLVVGCPLNERHPREPLYAPEQEVALAAPVPVRPASRQGPTSEPAARRGRSTHIPQQNSERSPASRHAESVVVQAQSGLALHQDLMPERTLAALSKETVVYAEPRRSSRKLGFLRQGALVRRDAQPSGRDGCSEGWFRIAPEGYVCVGKTATLDLDHPILSLAARQPDRSSAMPYVYGRARFPTPPLYTRIPTEAQQALEELDLVAQRRRAAYVRAWDNAAFSELPDLLHRGERVPRPFGYPVLARDFVSGRALPETGFAFLSFFEHEGRRWGLTTDFSIVPLDRVEPVQASSFHGLVLSPEMRLPVVFVRSKGAYLYRGDPRSVGLQIDRALEYREAIPVSGQKVDMASGRYLETVSGHWILDKHLVRVDPMTAAPTWAKGDRSWIEVSILNQTLVAYEGQRPVYVTLVSTGVGGLGDPAETHATVQGTFLIHTKHVTATMSSDAVGDEFDLRDVPYVQYFHDGYALHASYWHDSFGRPRSHGCINLSPADARWLFHWTGPAVPRAWHSALSLKEGTLVYIHP